MINRSALVAAQTLDGLIVRRSVRKRRMSLLLLAFNEPAKNEVEESVATGCDGLRQSVGY